MSEPKNSKDALEFIHTLDSLAIKKQKEEIERLNAEVESVRQVAKDNKTETEATRIENARLKNEVERLSEIVQTAHSDLFSENANLKAEVEGLRKELADAQENYHIVNEMVAKMLKEGKQS